MLLTMISGKISPILRLISLAGGTVLLSACAAGGSRPAPAPPPLPAAGLERVMGRAAGDLFALFGEPALDIREGPARKFQFAGSACVLDVYLYPPTPGGVPVVNYVEARTPQGGDFDRASCVGALARRAPAR